MALDGEGVDRDWENKRNESKIFTVQISTSEDCGNYKYTRNVKRARGGVLEKNEK